MKKMYVDKYILNKCKESKSFLTDIKTFTKEFKPIYDKKDIKIKNIISIIYLVNIINYAKI